MSAESNQAIGLLLSDDLIFTSRITATARTLGLEVRSATAQPALERLAEREATRCMILDLANPGLDVAALVRRVRAAGSAAPFVVAYGSHVDAAKLRAAREAGCDLVLPRSKFVEELPEALPRWFSGTQPAACQAAE
jgi:CheY-like chemotaxis protein